MVKEKWQSGHTGHSGPIWETSKRVWQEAANGGQAQALERHGFAFMHSTLKSFQAKRVMYNRDLYVQWETCMGDIQPHNLWEWYAWRSYLKLARRDKSNDTATDKEERKTEHPGGELSFAYLPSTILIIQDIYLECHIVRARRCVTRVSHS